MLNEHLRRSDEGYREWLIEYMSPIHCPACKGKRLKPCSLAVKVKGIVIAEFTALPIAGSADARNWKLNEREQQIAGAGSGRDPRPAWNSWRRWAWIT